MDIGSEQSSWIRPPPHKYLRDILAQRQQDQNIRFLRDPIRLTETPPELTSDIVKEALSHLPPFDAQQIREDSTKLYAFTILQADEHGRPLKTTDAKLATLLEEVDGKSWNKIFPRVQKKFGRKIDVTDETVLSLFDTYFAKQNVFTDQFEVWNSVFGPARTGNMSSYYQNLNFKLMERDSVTRLGELVPPKDPKDWFATIKETARYIQEGKMPMPDISYTTQELLTVNQMLFELVDELRIGGRDVQNTLQPIIVDKNIQGISFAEDMESTPKKIAQSLGTTIMNYDPSTDILDRYRFAIKFYLKSISYGKKGVPPNTQATQAERLLELVTNRTIHTAELVDWLARGGSQPYPSFFDADKTVPSQTKEVKTEKPNGKTYDYLDPNDKLPVPRDRKVRIFYTDKINRIPKELTVENWTFLSQELIEIPLTDTEAFNQVMSGLFGNPDDNTHKGNITFNAIKNILSKNRDFLIKIPYTNDFGFEHLRKIDVASQRVGVYGQWTTTLTPDKEQIIFITTQHKNLRRTR